MALYAAGKDSRSSEGMEMVLWDPEKKETNNMNILLTSAGRRTYLVEYFKEALKMAQSPGLVHAANSKISPAFLAADKKVVTPLIYQKEYIPFLLDYCRRWEIGLLVPLFDIDLPVLAAAREKFESQGTVVVTADVSEVEICNDKWKSFTALTGQGIKTPKTWLEAEKAVLAQREGEVSYPLIVKPRWGMGSLSVYQADDEEELLLFERKIQREIHDSYLKYEAGQEKANVIIQEKIQGTELGLDVVNDLNGIYRTCAAKKKEAMRAGETDEAQTVEIPELTRLGKQLAGFLRHRGNLDVDILERQGEYYVLEMNARFGGGYPFSHAAGLHLPYALVMWALGKEPEEKYFHAKAGLHAQKDIQMLVWGQEMGGSSQREG